jgi:hypothetical protein
LASIEIYIGAPIEHGSDRDLLKSAAALLAAADVPAILIANTELAGRQIDLILAVEGAAAVLEGKGYSSPVRGGANGAWQVRLASGEWKNERNLYSQTVDARHAVRDAMSQFDRADVPYPRAALVFLPHIPAGSSIGTGDFKAAILGAEELSKMVPPVAGQGWSLARWREFASAHRLSLVPSLEAALDPVLADAEQLLSQYSEAFIRTYGPVAAELVSGRCRGQGASLSFDELAARARAEPSLVLMGPSGCGKSLLSYRLALEAMHRGAIPVILPAKDFQGSLRDVANREVTMLGAPSVRHLLAAARRLDRPALWVIDGYNECNIGERGRLTRSIVAAARRYGAHVVLSSRSAVDRADLLGLREYFVEPPDRETKLAIAKGGSDGADHDLVLPLLETAASGLEARIVGQLGRRLTGETSRYGLFDAYIRARLGPEASAGIRALCRIAGTMFDRLSFGLSVRAVDRLFDREGLKADILQALVGANIIETRGDRFTFSHEMFLNVFAAEAAVRQADGNADALRHVLSSPRHSDTKALIVAAIDDDALCLRVLENVADVDILRACLAGQCGRAARRWANQLCDDVLTRVDEEIDTLAFGFDTEGFMGISANADAVRDWSAQERAVMAVIPTELAAGRRIDALLAIIARMDAKLADEFRRLRTELGDRQVALRSALFAHCYVWSGSVGLSQIMAPVHSGSLYSGPNIAAEADLRRRLSSASLTHGQLSLLLRLQRHDRRDAPPIADILPGILERNWRYAPYHLRLDLMEVCGFAGWNAPEEDRKALIRAVEALLPIENVMLSTAVIDALKFLGGLEDQEADYIENVRAEIAAILEDEHDPTRCQMACGLWNSQFDHPFDGAYCQGWNELSPERRKILLCMAARGADEDAFSMFLPTLMVYLATYNDPALGPLIARFAGLPPHRCVMPQEAIKNFATSHILLGRLGCPLPSPPAEALSAAEEALLACGTILYWLNRIDLAMAERKQHCEAALRVLGNHAAGVAASIVQEFDFSDLVLSESVKELPGGETISRSIGDAFPAAIAEVYRAALRAPTTQSGYFDFFRPEDVVEACLMGLGRYGSVDDIEAIKLWSHYPRRIGEHAVAAIKQLQAAALRTASG